MGILKATTGVIVDKSKDAVYMKAKVKKLQNRIENLKKKVVSLQNKNTDLHKKALVAKIKAASLQRQILDNEDGVIGEYERDLVWMAYRYAIGRHTIHAAVMCQDMCRNIPGRFSKARQQFMAMDIQREIAVHLRFTPFTFSVDSSILPGTPDYYPLDHLIEFLLEHDVRTKEDMLKYKSVTYMGRTPNKKANLWDIRYRLDGDEKPFISWMEWEDLLMWNNLSKLLDERCHRWAVLKDKRYKDKAVMVEYFCAYRRRAGYNVPEDEGKPMYEQIYIPVVPFKQNPAVCCYIDMAAVLVDNIEKEDIDYFKEQYHIQLEKM